MWATFTGSIFQLPMVANSGAADLLWSFKMTTSGDLPVVLVVPLTTARAAIRFAGTTLIRPTANNGLRQSSVALIFQLWAIDRRRIQERIGTVGAEVLNAMFEEPGKLTGRSV